jgi:tetratricopeptide (TPR) repeat protein
VILPSLERVQLLIQQSRYRQAEQELREILFHAPEEPLVHALLALCLSEQEQLKEALAFAHTAVTLAPDSAWCKYILATIFSRLGKLNQAREVILEAISQEPNDPDYYALLGSLFLQENRWQEALEWAEQGLSLEPEHVVCSNLRSMSLIKLGRGDAALQGLESALNQEPDNALTHANRGWTLLENGQNEAALLAFQEALSLDPNQEWARDGLVEALKARYFIYRLMLKYFFLMSRLRRGKQWMVMLGLLLFVRLLRLVFPPTAHFWLSGLVLGAYFGFVMLTWLADPLFNLVLRFNRYGRLALSQEQVIASNWLGGLLSAGLLSGGGGIIFKSWPFIAASIFSFSMTIPVSGSLAATDKHSRNFLVIYTVMLAILGISGITSLALGLGNLSLILIVAFSLGWVGFSWTANILPWRKA